MSGERQAYWDLVLAVALSYLSPVLPYGRTRRYGHDREQRSILFAPRSSEARARVPVLFVHGGSWTGGSPRTYRFVGRRLAGDRPAAVVGYRLAPRAVFPAQLEDVRAALKHAVGWWRQRGCPCERVVIAGQSAGAHLAALAALEERDTARAASADVSGFASVSGPLDLRTICAQPSWCPSVSALMGGDEGWDRADPLLKLSGRERFSIFALHGTSDRIVSPVASERFVERARALGLDARLMLIENGYHSSLMRMFVEDGAAWRALSGYLNEIDLNGPMTRSE